MKSILGQLLNGRYLVVRQLEQKSSHTTYLAEDQYKLEQGKCVVKQYRLSNLIKVNNFQANKNFKSFLFREIQKVRQFDNHPQVAAILDYFLWGEEFYLVRQFIVGKTLKEEIADFQLGEPQVIRLLQETLTILKTIHQGKEFYLNLKPSNIIFVSGTQRIAIADFARIQALLKDRIINSEIISNTSIIDNYYLAPEQKLGNPQISSDFHTLGAIAIEALTGKYLHEVKLCDLDNYARASIVELETGKITHISSQLAKVLQNITNSNPEVRYQSAEEILRSLEESGKMVLLPSPSVFTANYELPENFSKKRKVTKKKGAKFTVSPIILGGLTLLSLAVAGFILLPDLAIDRYQKFAEYHNDRYNIALKYPQTWTVRELEDPITGDIAVLTSPLESQSDLFQEQVYLSIDYLSITPEEYKQIIFDKIENADNITNISYKKESVKLANQSVYSITYSRKQDNLDLQQKEVFAIENGKVYLITYIAEKERYRGFLKTVNQIIKSLTIY